MARPIPISAAKTVAYDYGYDQVIIIARRTDPAPDATEHVTTYGRNKVHCDVAAHTGNFLKHKIMGWPQDFGTKALNDIAAERKRQIEVEGWTPENDDGWDDHQLAYAGGSYAIANRLIGWGIGEKPPSSWPFDPQWWKPSTDPRRNLIKAGALIVAELERIDRAEAKSSLSAPHSGGEVDSDRSSESITGRTDRPISDTEAVEGARWPSADLQPQGALSHD